MKNLIAVTLLVGSLSACARLGGGAPKSEDDKTLYALGMIIGRNLSDFNLTPRELAEGRFRTVLDDDEARTRAGEIRRVILCSGKVYVDLAGSDKRAAARDVAIARIEQLYPVPAQNLRGLFDAYGSAEEIVWVQEEPENMGAWDFVRPHLVEAAAGRPVRVIGRYVAIFTLAFGLFGLILWLAGSEVRVPLGAGLEGPVTTHGDECQRDPVVAREHREGLWPTRENRHDLL